MDVYDDPRLLDNDFTPTGNRNWDDKRYRHKLSNLAHAMIKIGTNENKHPPVIIGVAEVENDKVLKDLLETNPLATVDYHFIHFDSPDERGIDTALIYRPKYFEVFHAEPLPLIVNNLNGVRDMTRDILYVHGKFHHEEVHVFVNHWPSKRDGNEATEYKRIEATRVIGERMEIIKRKDKNPNFIVMGDFNDGPDSVSIQTLVEEGKLYNPMVALNQPKLRGSSSHKRSWSLFDQIMVSKSFLHAKQGELGFKSANIFDDNSLKEKSGKYKGSPLRTFVGHKYMGGYSDHFPVYVILQLIK